MSRTAAFLLVLVFSGACGPPDDASTGAPASGSAPAEPAGMEGAGTGSASEREALRVVFLGTSLTAGFGLLRDSERYTERLQELADSSGLPVETVNAGVSGETSAAGLRRLDWVLEEPVDVLVVELGANDGLRGRDPAALESDLRQIVRRARQRYPDLPVVLVGMEAPPNMGERYASRFREVFPRVAEETGAAFVPFLLEGVAGVPELNQDDRIHPTAEGHRRMARNVWPVLEPVLRARLQGAAVGANSGDGDVGGAP